MLNISEYSMIYLFVEYNNNNNKEIFIRFKRYNSRNKILFLLKEEFIISPMYTAFDWYKLWKGNCEKDIVLNELL